jgi:putative transposase
MKLKKFQQRFSNQQTRQGKKHIRRKKLTSNALKTLKKIHKIIDKIRNIQDDYFHKISLELIQKYDNICLETLSIKNMLKNKRLSHSIHEASWYKFITLLKYKSEWYDKKFIQVSNRFPSSKLCNKCGWKYKDLTLNIRKWTCPECGTKHDRDINASINILNEGLKFLNRRDGGDSLVS